MDKVLRLFKLLFSRHFEFILIRLLTLYSFRNITDVEADICSLPYFISGELQGIGGYGRLDSTAAPK